MTTETLNAPEPATLPGATRFDLASKISGRTYRISVYKPLGPSPEGGFPVIYVTDAALTFPIAATMSLALGLTGEKQAMVVGVGYPTAEDDRLTAMFMRTRDLTPPTPLEAIHAQPGLPPPQAENYGGSEPFFRFLTEELRPAIAAEHEINLADQTLYGHSLGGLFTLEVLFRHPEAFRTYAASSPSIWWNSKAVLADEAAFTARVAAGEIKPRVLVMVGGTEQEPPHVLPPMMTVEKMGELMREARMVDNARELGERLVALKGGKGYAAQVQVFEQEDHMTVVAASLGRTLAFALRG